MSLFKGISWPPESLWEFAGSAVPKKQSYFDLRIGKTSGIKPDQFYEKFDETVQESSPVIWKAPREVALSLTAGLDTRVVLASVGDGEDLSLLYIRGLWGETFDVQAARKLAAVCNRPHEVISINERFLKDFPSFAKKVSIFQMVHTMRLGRTMCISMRWP